MENLRFDYLSLSLAKETKKDQLCAGLNSDQGDLFKTGWAISGVLGWTG